MATPVESRRAVAVDPVTASIIQHGLDAAADQMLVALKRTAFSPIIYDILDGGGAFYDRHFRMLSQIQTLPLFTGSLGLCIESVANHYRDRGGLQDGDVLVVNDPFLTGTHQWDVAVIVPGFIDGELVAYAGIKAHQLDVGALAPFVSNSTDVFQEGTIYPGVKLYKAGELDEDLYRTMLANTRLPESAAGDLSAQAGACRTGLRGAARADGALRARAVRRRGRGHPRRGRGEDARAPGRAPARPVHEHDRPRAQRPRAGDAPLRGRRRDRRGRDHDRPDRRAARAAGSRQRSAGGRRVGDPLRDDGAGDRRRARERGLLPSAQAEDAPGLDVRCPAARCVRAGQLPAVHPDRGHQRGARPGGPRADAGRVRHVRLARAVGARRAGTRSGPTRSTSSAARPPPPATGTAAAR